MGMLQISFVAYTQIAATLLLPVGVYHNFDPFLFLAQDLGFGDVALQPAYIHVSRYVITFICGFEVIRTVCLLLNPLLMEHCIYNKILLYLKEQPLNTITLQLYSKLTIIKNHGDNMVSYAIFILLGTSFFMTVILTFFLFVGWKVFPFSMYLGGLLLNVLIYFIIHLIFPLIIKSHQLSFKMINSDWPRTFSCNRWNVQRRKFTTRKLASLQPITFRWGVFGLPININLRRDFLWHVVQKSLDLLLLSKKWVVT